MEHWDIDLEQRVWRRVRGDSGDSLDLTELIQLSRAQTADLKMLDRELFRQERQTLALLTGLHALHGGSSLPPVRISPGDRRQRLLRSRERCQRMLQLLVALENHSRYGSLFTELTRQQRAKCARLEQLWRSQPGRRDVN